MKPKTFPGSRKLGAKRSVLLGSTIYSIGTLLTFITIKVGCQLLAIFFGCLSSKISCFVIKVIIYQRRVKICRSRLKGQCHEISRFWFFSWISFPPAPEYSIRTVSNFFENSRRYLQLKVDHRCRWHRWQMKKNFNKKNLTYFVGTPLDRRVNICKNFCLQVHF